MTLKKIHQGTLNLINTFRNETEYKINSTNYNIKSTEKDIRETYYMTVSNTIKYNEVILMTKLIDLYD